MKIKHLAKAVETRYWMPGDNYLQTIAETLEGKIGNRDIVAVSEKALSTAKGRIIDEGQVKPGFVAKFLARFWMRIIWGYFLCRICHLKAENIHRLRNYPLKEGSAHKQVALWHASFLQTLVWGSEGGIDASNLPYSYVSIPLDDPQETAEEIRLYLKNRLGKNITVLIVDTDKTYSLGGFHFTHRPKPLRPIRSFFGIVAYVAGRGLRLKRRSTPLAVAGSTFDASLALDLAEAAHKCRGSGAGPTVWDMAETFGVSITSVTWNMLESLKHKPLIIFKFGKCSGRYLKT
jgi:F420-0:gamma-glutamyl ligase-like protein